MDQNRRNLKRGNLILVFPLGWSAWSAWAGWSGWGAAVLIWLAAQPPNHTSAYQLTPLQPESSLTCPGCFSNRSIEHGAVRVDRTREERTSPQAVLQPIPLQSSLVSPLPHAPRQLHQLTSKLLQPIKIGELSTANQPVKPSRPTASQPIDHRFPSATEKIDDSDDSMAEIMEIRAAFGGGVAQMLADSPLQSEENERLFAQQLKNLIGETQLSSHQSDGPLTPINPQTSGRSDNPPTSITAVPGTSTEEIQILRRSAQQLEQVAAQLEQAGLYEQADSVRSTGIELWKAARSLSFHSTTTD